MDIATRILNGEADSDFDRIQEAIKQRRKSLGAIKMAGLKPGDKVTIASTVKPKYLAGASATVVKVNNTRVRVDLDVPAGRFHRNVELPSVLLG